MKRVAIGMLSNPNAPENDRRNRCRETFLREIKEKHSAQFSSYFLYGERVVRGFGEIQNDLLLLPCQEGYAQLPQKTRAFCRWFLGTDYDYLFKCDDDTYICVERFKKYIDSELNGDYVGGKWTETVDYCSGGAGYFLSRRAAAMISEQLDMETGAEDLEVGRILRKSGVVPTYDSRFVAVWNYRNKLHKAPRLDNNIITAHAMDGEVWMDCDSVFRLNQNHSFATQAKLSNETPRVRKSQPKSTPIVTARASHRHWKDSLTFDTEKKIFWRNGLKDGGKYDVSGARLTLRWDGWPPENLHRAGTNKYEGNDGYSFELLITSGSLK